MSKSPSSPIPAVLAPLLLILAASCSSGSSGNSNHSPTVLSNVPLGNAVDVPVNASMSATFSEAMNANTLTDVTFTVTQGLAAVPVAGTVIYANSTAVFWPTVHLADNEDFTATITRGAQDSAGNGLAVNHVWTFTTGTSVEPGQGVDLGQSGNFVILAKAGISTVPASVITGNVGLSPAAASFLTGFSLTMDPSNAFSTSTQVTGNVYAADYAAPTPASLTTSVLDMETAFTDAAGRAADVTELGAGNVGGMTLAPGVYKWGTGLLVPTDLTLTGSATDVWIFQIAEDLTLSAATDVVLTGGALPENVIWQVTGLVSIGTTAHLEGIVLCATAITVHTGASVNGRLLAQTAVTLDTNTIVEPAP